MDKRFQKKRKVAGKAKSESPEHQVRCRIDMMTAYSVRGSSLADPWTSSISPFLRANKNVVRPKSAITTLTPHSRHALDSEDRRLYSVIELVQARPKERPRDR